jgi:hypothetical protein
MHSVAVVGLTIVLLLEPRICIHISAGCPCLASSYELSVGVPGHMYNLQDDHEAGLLLRQCSHMLCRTAISWAAVA